MSTSTPSSLSPCAPGSRTSSNRTTFEVPAMNEELEQFGMFRSLFRRAKTFLDIFDSATPLGEAILDRRREAVVAGKRMWTISAEDLALLKAPSDRERDFGDLT